MEITQVLSQEVKEVCQVCQEVCPEASLGKEDNRLEDKDLRLMKSIET
jgi:hypothetical protein